MRMAIISKKEVGQSRMDSVVQNSVDVLMSKIYSNQKARTININSSIQIHANDSPSILEHTEEKQAQPSARTDISNLNEEEHEEKYDQNKNILEFLYNIKNRNEDFDKDIVKKKMEQFWKYSIWKIKKWLIKYKK